MRGRDLKTKRRIFGILGRFSFYGVYRVNLENVFVIKTKNIGYRDTNEVCFENNNEVAAFS